MPIEFKHIEMVGRLAKDEEIKGFEDYGRTAVFINKPGDIQYKIKSLSTKNDVAEEQFTGYISSIRNLEFVDDQYSAPEDRVKAFSDFYSKSLFVFSHKIDSMGNVKVDVADVLTRPLVIDENTKFVAIPCFSGKTQCDKIDANGSWPLFREYDNFGEFFQRLVENKTVGRIYNFQINDATSFPEFIVWNDSRKMCAIGPIKSASRTAMDSLMIQINIENYCEINLDDEDDDILEYIVQSPSNPSLIHIAEKKYIDIINRIAQKVEENNAAHAAQAASTANLTKQEESDRDQQNSVSQGAPVAQEPPSDDLRELPTEKTETAIFKFFRYHSQKNKLFYSPKDIVNFHTAIKTGNLVILSGMSGTGKSALVDTYAKALGIGKSNVLIIPVRPSWNDDSDLLGYVDLVHMVYRPSDTGFINKIVEASRPENKDKLYLICLDEMNLARVEHYFSQFLSILERPVGARELVLYDEQYANQLYNSSKYPQQVSIGDNVKFVGTVNIDESTYHFSDKVLDRANVISLEVLDYSQPNNWKEDKYRAANTPEWSNEDFGKLIKKDDAQLQNQTRIREFLWEMHTLLHGTNANLGVGPRIVKSIEMYLRNLPEGDTEYVLSEAEGLDYQVAQRILTKIRGPEEQLKELFQTQEQKNALIMLLDKFDDISKFERCRQAITQKEKELKVYGYCL